MVSLVFDLASILRAGTKRNEIIKGVCWFLSRFNSGYSHRLDSSVEVTLALFFKTSDEARPWYWPSGPSWQPVFRWDLHFGDPWGSPIALTVECCIQAGKLVAEVGVAVGAPGNTTSAYQVVRCPLSAVCNRAAHDIPVVDSYGLNCLQTNSFYACSLAR